MNMKTIFPTWLRTTFAVWITLAISALTVAAANCTKCGKKLSFGFGTCLECKQEALKPVVKAAEPLLKAAEPVLARLSNNVASAEHCGEVWRFDPKGQYRYAGPTDRDLLFINGMRTDFADFKQQAQMLADVLGRPVTAVYAGGLTRGVATSPLIEIQNLTKLGAVEQLPEAKSLANELRRAEQGSRKVDLVCYSRGTMLTEAILQRQGAWAGNNVTVYALGCAVAGTFPVRNYYKIVNRQDSLMKDRMVDNRQVVWGRDGTHDLADYIKNLETSNYDAALPLMESVTRK
jgi:hypothetical protein